MSSLLVIAPAVVPMATAFDTERKGLALSPQAKIPRTVVFWNLSTFTCPCSVKLHPNVSGILQCCS